YILTKEGHLYDYYERSNKFQKVESIDNLAYTFSEGMGYTPVLYTNDNKLMMIIKNASTGILDEYYNVTEYGDPIYISRGIKIMYVYDDGTVIWGAPGLNHYTDGAVPVVDENDPDKAKVRKTELMRRYDLAGRLMDLYEECGGE